MLGVSRQRVAQLALAYDDFPSPEAELAAGRIWSKDSIADWIRSHPGRSEADDRMIRCSFCDSTQDDVQQMISGRGLAICNGCIDLAATSVLRDSGWDALLLVKAFFVSDKATVPLDVLEQIRPLTGKHLRVMIVRLGIDSGSPRTLGEAQSVLGMSGEEILHIEKEALAIIAAHFKQT